MDCEEIPEGILMSAGFGRDNFQLKSEKNKYYGGSKKLSTRHTVGKIWQVIFASSTLVGILALAILLLNILNNAFGYIALENEIQPELLAIDGVSIEEMPKEDLVAVLGENVSKGLMRRFESEMSWDERTRDDVYNLVLERVVEPKPVAQWTLFDSLFNVDMIQRDMLDNYPDADLIFKSWITPSFITKPQSSNAYNAGVRTALLGSLWTIFISILFSFPIGVGAAIYLQEYAKDNFFNRIIQTNINNLAGVPSIIYGMLGLALFVRALNQITSGAVFGYTDPMTANGRTILSGGLTLGLLILPLIIINAQEAIKAVPNSLREASYGIGATRWQTIWHHVLPSALPGILTGTILAISRAIGETAPLVVVGASTFITFDPDGPFSKFTTLPIQIYQWTARPQDVFRNIAAGAIIVLLILLLSMNAIAVLLRNRYSRRI